MPLRRPKRNGPPPSLHRGFVTPEGVDLRLELASAGSRAAAFLIDAMIIVITLILVTIAIALLAIGTLRAELAAILWLVGFFILRNGWFTLFEMGERGATPGKRLLGLRVIARDGARLTGGAIVARNAMREIEVFLPLSFLGAQAAEGAADGFLILFALLWSGTFLFFPLMNRDRLRIGDILAGTWVVNNVRGRLAEDLGAVRPERPQRLFTEAALSLYGVYELQTLEDVIRQGNPEAIAIVASTIRRKAALVDEGDDDAFLSDYYVALCARLERGMLIGRKREDKHAL